jgi:euchromatic histone-lysine N-methyltransferase
LQLEPPPADAGLGAVATTGGRSDACAVDSVEAVSKSALGGTVEVQEQEDGEIPTETDHVLLQESHVTLNKDLHELRAGTREPAAPPVVAVKPSIRHSSSEKLHENMLQRSANTVSWAVAEDANVMNKCEASSPKVATKPSAQAPPNEYQVKAGRHERAVPPVVAAKPSMGQFSNEKIHGNMPQSKGKAVSWAVAEDVQVMNKSQASSPKVASKPSAEGPPKECLQDKEVSGSCSMKGVQGQGIMRSKVTFTARKTVQLPVEANHKPSLVNLDRPYSTGKETESVTTVKESFAPRKKLKVIGPAQNKYFPVNVAPTSALPSKVKLKDKEASALDGDDGIWKAIGGNEGKLKMYLSGPSCVPSIRRHVQHGGQSADARSKVKMLCRKFQFICRTLVQDAEQHSVKSSRIDLAADKIIRTLPGYTKHGAIMGEVPGVEIGDEFLYRVELALVGLHRPYQGGIDTMKDHNDTLIAISIVASGGYPDELSSSGEVIYTGSGGKPAGKKENEDQKLVRGNLALKNCIKTKTPVRVIHGFKGPNREEGSHSKAKEVSTFTYDGLYNVVDSWLEGPPGSRVFKYRLQRIPGQPELPLHVAKGLRKSIVRPGICIADISQGKEKTPICVINNIDNARPTPFNYITRNRGPSLTANRSQGCDCTDGCSDSANCTCIVKNGGEIPFNFNGAVVHAKPLIFECGPSCKCPPSCHNRVSQLGMKIPLEVFRTAKTGWGVRSLRSIPAGSFICEYVGELLHGQEANQISNDEYLFDIGQNYDIWKDMPSAIPGLNPSGARSLTMEDDEGFTIDAAEYGNIGRFINHSCSPNLYAQNVLWDHDDKRVPHIMFFADENISPLQELTYDYNYEIGHVHDVNGVVKVKYCHCGSAQCRGRLY